MKEKRLPWDSSEDEVSHVRCVAHEDEVTYGRCVALGYAVAHGVM